MTGQPRPPIEPQPPAEPQPRAANEPVEDGRLDAVELRGAALYFTFNGRTVKAFEGESVAAALLAAGLRTLRHSPALNQPRGVFCNMGVCFDCLVEIDGRPNLQACLTAVRGGMHVASGGQRGEEGAPG